MPVFGYHPTSSWQPGEIVTDLHCVVAPSGLARGEYTIRTGLYDAGSGSRLELIDPPHAENAVDLLTIDLP